jgi:hypothetical protein
VTQKWPLVRFGLFPPLGRPQASGMAMVVYCGMLVALVDRDPVEGIYKMSISRKLQRARARAMEKPQVKRAVADARKDFIAKFGREPLEGEPLIFDPDFDTPTPYTDEKMTNMMVEAMEAAGIPDHLIFAYRKTGMIMGAENAGLWTEKEINEWNAAIAEYEALHGPIGEEG